MSRSPTSPPPEKPGLHPRNRHRAGYDFSQLATVCPELGAFVRPNPHDGGDTIDFADPTAVTALNRALLKHDYGIGFWDIPPGYLCPPIPSRADYVHHLADLLSDGDAVAIPRGDGVAVLDIGVGANCIYPLLGCREYGWRFVGVDIDPIALDSAKRIIAANPVLGGRIELRRQHSASDIFENVVKPAERFAASICNPPFHASAAEAAAGTRRKVRNLGGGKAAQSVLNFGGRNHELWCPGGEIGFVRRMIVQSARRPETCRWFTTLVSKSASLPAVYQALRDVRAVEVHTLDMAQGQKKSRIVAWRFES